MSNLIQFKEKDVRKVEKDFEKTKVDATLRDYLSNVAAIYAKYIPLPEIALRGFLHMETRQVSQEFKVEPLAIMKLPAAQAEKIHARGKEIFREMLFKVLTHQEDREKLKIAIGQADAYVATLLAKK